MKFLEYFLDYFCNGSFPRGGKLEQYLDFEFNWKAIKIQNPQTVLIISLSFDFITVFFVSVSAASLESTCRQENRTYDEPL